MSKVALITGANKGIGLETARQLARQGITVLIGARDRAKGDAAAAELKKEGADAQALLLDVDETAHHTAAHDAIEKQFGKLDILINNAGIAREASIRRLGFGDGLPPSESPMDNIRAVFETNFFGTVALTQALLPLLRKSSAGRIVNVTSRLASMTINSAATEKGWYDEVGYNTSKAAMNMFTILLGRELKSTPIKINSAHPGWVQTELGGPNAPVTIEDGAKTSVWLATLPADGPTGGFFYQQESLPW